MKQVEHSNTVTIVATIVSGIWASLEQSILLIYITLACLLFSVHFHHFKTYCVFRDDNNTIEVQRLIGSRVLKRSEIKKAYVSTLFTLIVLKSGRLWYYDFLMLSNKHKEVLDSFIKGDLNYDELV